MDDSDVENIYIYIYIYNISYVNRNTIIIIFNNIYYYVHLKKT